MTGGAAGRKQEHRREEEARGKIKHHVALTVLLTSCFSRNPCVVIVIAKSPQLITFILELMVDNIVHTLL